jgi:membrane protease YdiL (CAAX protease family)
MILLIIIMKFINPNGLFTGFSNDRSQFALTIPFYLVIGSFIQEFIFRAYLFAVTKSLWRKVNVIILNIFLFSFFHLPYFVQLNSNLTYLSVGAGIIWSTLYYYFPNLYMAWLSHAITGSLTLLLLQSF